MTNEGRILGAIVVPILALLPCSSPFAPWQTYTFHAGSFSPSPHPLIPPSPPPLISSSQPPLIPTTPTDWHVTATAFADATNDGAAEWVLLVWRPWRDWPIQRWSPVPSPIAGFHDAADQSCHLILLDPRSGREIWAGSALPAPLLTLAVGDVDGDGHNEVTALEGSYAAGRDGPASRVTVWRWNGFGFTLEWRSPPGVFYQLRLTDANNDGILDVTVR